MSAKKIRWRDSTQESRKGCPDTWYTTGEWIPTNSGIYPQEFTIEIFMPASWSLEYFYWYKMEAWMQERFEFHKWWSYTVPGPPAIWRAEILSVPHDARKPKEQMQLI